MKNDIGKRIAELRREHGYNQEQLAEMAMLNRVTLARYETGVIEPGALAIGRIADALGLMSKSVISAHFARRLVVNLVVKESNLQNRCAYPASNL